MFSKDDLEKQVALLESQISDLHTQLETVKRSFHKTFSEIDQYINEREVMIFPSDIVELNVGGVYICTLRSTLTEMFPESMLAVMFSGRHHLITDSMGRYFIDRNGEMFKYVVDFLRTGILPVFDREGEEISFMRELEYFQIDPRGKIVFDVDMDSEVLLLRTAMCQNCRFESHYVAFDITYDGDARILFLSCGGNGIMGEWQDLIFQRIEEKCLVILSDTKFLSTGSASCLSKRFYQYLPIELLEYGLGSERVHWKYPEYGIDATLERVSSPVCSSIGKKLKGHPLYYTTTSHHVVFINGHCGSTTDDYIEKVIRLSIDTMKNK